MAILCECGEFVEGETFKDYIETSANPSTSTIGHRKCGLIYDFVDGKMPRRFSSKAELKSIAMKLAARKNLEYGQIERFLIEVDRIKSEGKLHDAQILAVALGRVTGK